MLQLAYAIAALGLLLDLVGAVLLGVDFLRGPLRADRNERFKGRRAAIERIRSDVVSSNQALPKPPYTQDKIDEFCDRTREHYARLEAELDEEIRGFRKEEDSTSQWFGWRGIYCLCIGFSLQFVAVLLQASNRP